MTADDSRAVPDTETMPDLLAALQASIDRARGRGRSADGCTCLPCTTPGRGHPTIEHCAACCSGSGIEEYDHNCPVAEHRVMAARQFPPALTRDVPTPKAVTDLVVMDPYLCGRTTDSCTCDPFDGQHRDYCGWEPLFLVEDVRAALARDVPAGRDLTAQDVQAVPTHGWDDAEIVADYLNRIARGDQR